MKKFTALLLTALLLFALCGCHQAPEEPTQLYCFYYRTAETSYDSAAGVIAAEERDINNRTVDAELLLTEFLKGPSDETLVSPFSRDVVLKSVELRDEGLLEIQLGGSYLELSGINASIADVCITQTMLQLDDVIRVHIMVVNSLGATEREVSLTQSDLVLFDDGSAASETELTLYFADSRSRFLLAEKRTIAYIDETLLPQYIVEQLIAGPKTAGLYPTIPESATLLDINVENGVCSVDFSADFLANKPTQELSERATVFSVVNSLTALDSIDSVQLYVEGQLQQRYLYLDISGRFVMDSKVIGPVRTDMSETDVTVFLPSEDSIALHTIPLRVKQTSNESREEAVLNALLCCQTANSLKNPLPAGTQLQSVTLTDTVCTVTFNKAFLDSDDEQIRQAIRCISATLVNLTGISSVRLFAEDEQITLGLTDGIDVYTPQPDWFCTYMQP